MHHVSLSSGVSFEVSEGLSFLEAAAKSGIHLPYSCKNGRCSTCKCKIISGETKALYSELGLTKSEIDDGWILSCVRTATTDVVLDAKELGKGVLPPVKTQACRISSLEKMAPDVIKIVLRLPTNAKFDFIPGQYIDVIGPGGVRRSYSLANAPSKNNTLELHVRAVEGGGMSHYWFNQATVNDLLRLHGPLGTFFLRDIVQRDLIFLATGTGIAPVKAMLEALSDFSEDKRPRSVTVLWGGRYESDLYFNMTVFPSWFRYIPVLSRAEGWYGEHGYVQDILLRHKSDFLDCSVYACGSDAMIHSAKIALIESGLPSHFFYSDAFVCTNTSVHQ